VGEFVGWVFLALFVHVAKCC